MPYFRRKPVVVEARLLTHENLIETSKWCNGYERVYTIPPLGRVINITTLEGTMFAVPGDWIVRGTKGEFYPCKPDIFQDSYEEVSGIYADEPT